MSIIIRLQNLPWAANSVDIRRYFAGLSIPEGGVHIVGGEKGDAFIAFSTDEDARQAMEKDCGKIKDMRVKLLLSSRTEMMRVIEQARNQNVSAQSSIITTVNKAAVNDSDRRKSADHGSSPRRREREKSPVRDRGSRRTTSRRDRSRSRSRSRSPARRSKDRDRDQDRRSDRSKRDDRRSDDSQRSRDERPKPVRDSSQREPFVDKKQSISDCEPSQAQNKMMPPISGFSDSNPLEANIPRSQPYDHRSMPADSNRSGFPYDSRPPNTSVAQHSSFDSRGFSVSGSSYNFNPNVSLAANSEKFAPKNMNEPDGSSPFHMKNNAGNFHSVDRRYGPVSQPSSVPSMYDKPRSPATAIAPAEFDKRAGVMNQPGNPFSKGFGVPNPMGSYEKFDIHQNQGKDPGYDKPPIFSNQPFGNPTQFNIPSDRVTVPSTPYDRNAVGQPVTSVPPYAHKPAYGTEPPMGYEQIPAPNQGSRSTASPTVEMNEAGLYGKRLPPNIPTTGPPTSGTFDRTSGRSHTNQYEQEFAPPREASFFSPNNPAHMSPNVPFSRPAPEGNRDNPNVPFSHNALGGSKDNQYDKPGHMHSPMHGGMFQPPREGMFNKNEEMWSKQPPPHSDLPRSEPGPWIEERPGLLQPPPLPPPKLGAFNQAAVAPKFPSEDMSKPEGSHNSGPMKESFRDNLVDNRQLHSDPMHNERRHHTEVRPHPDSMPDGRHHHDMGLESRRPQSVMPDARRHMFETGLPDPMLDSRRLQSDPMRNEQRPPDSMPDSRRPPSFMPDSLGPPDALLGNRGPSGGMYDGRRSDSMLGRRPPNSLHDGRRPPDPPDGRRLDILPDGRRPDIPPDARRPPDLPLGGRRLPDLPPDGRRLPDLPPDGRRLPDLPSDGRRLPDLPSDGRRPPDLPPDGRRPPDLPPDGRRPPDLPPDGRRPHDLPPDGRRQPDLPPDGRRPHDLPSDGRRLPDLPPEGRRQPDLPPVGRRPPDALSSDRRPPDAMSDTRGPSDAMIGTRRPPDAIIDTRRPPDAMIDTRRPPNAMIDTRRPPDAMVDTRRPPDAMVDTRRPPDAMTDTRRPADAMINTRRPPDAMVDTRRPPGLMPDNRRPLNAMLDGRPQSELHDGKQLPPESVHDERRSISDSVPDGRSPCTDSHSVGKRPHPDSLETRRLPPDAFQGNKRLHPDSFMDNRGSRLDSFPDRRPPTNNFQEGGRPHLDAFHDGRRNHPDGPDSRRSYQDSQPSRSRTDSQLENRPLLDQSFPRQENQAVNENFDRPPVRGKRDPLIREPRNAGPLLDMGEPPNKMPRGPPSLTVEVRGLPFDACEADVLELFRGIFVPPENMKLVHDNHGQPAGNAFVKFLNQRDYEEGLSRNEQYIGNSCPEVIACPTSVFEDAVSSNSPVSHGKGPHMNRRKPPPREEDLIVELQGLPYSCKDEDIVHFFDGLRILDIFIERAPNGRASGAGYVEFGTPDDLQAALKVDGKLIGHRYINIIVSSKESMIASRGNFGPLLNEPPFEKRSSGRERGLPQGRERVPNQGRERAPPQGRERAPPQGRERGPHSGRERGPPGRERGPPPGRERGPHPGRERGPPPGNERVPPPGNERGPPPGNERGPPPGSEKGPHTMPQEHVPRGGPPGNQTTFCVRLLGLPKTINNGDIAEFFSLVSVIPHAIHIMLDSNKVPTGEAFSEFNTVKERETAMQQKGKMLADIPVSITPISYFEMVQTLGCPPTGPGPLPPPPLPPLLKNPPDEERTVRRPLIDIRPGNPNPVGEAMITENVEHESGHEPLLSGRQHPPFESNEPPMGGRPPFPRMRGSNGPPRVNRPRNFGPERSARGPPPFRGRGHRPPTGPPHADNGPPNFGAPGCVVGMNNLHYNAGLGELLDLFHGYSLNKDNIIRKYNDLGQATGEARVAFRCPDDAIKAVEELNRKPVLGRPVVLSLI